MENDSKYLQKIVFYDGECGFCNYIVGFILKYEKNESLYFSALQSELAQTLLVEKQGVILDLSTFYYLNNDILFKKSNGFFSLLKELKYPVRFLRIFQFIPTFLTDKIYDFIATRRRKIQSPKCYFPTPEQRQRFIR
jgi:predicted DCC family thiol-disulfide oxidoreductase YuxK